jgi:hypothetical protein|tara:strand:- start:1876 stop:1989 length:114 start_codon:yes stop_codon:yes gene_type:complete
MQQASPAEVFSVKEDAKSEKKTEKADKYGAIDFDRIL